MKKKLRKPKFRPYKRTENRFVIAFQRAQAHFLDGIEHEILFNNQKQKPCNKMKQASHQLR
jgi:hypothetical protein